MIEVHPDLLQRFVPTPFTCTVRHGDSQTHVDSNSEALVSAIRTGPSQLEAIAHLKIIVDHLATEDSTTHTHINSAHLNTLLRGTTTILIFDRDTRELLAFLAPQVTSAEFLNQLIPAVLCGHQVAELQTHDIGTIAS